MRSKPGYELPPYTTPSGPASIKITPPFSFQGMTARVFPLRANLEALQRFCDNYVNIIPEEVGCFRVRFPYINLMFVNYGRMAVDVANTGWLAQREIVFSVPLEWYRRVNGRLEFVDWATIAPFIFVDDDLSTTVGRTVYGWPKTIAKLNATESAWMQDPLAPIAEASVSTMVFPELYKGEKLEERVFLEIERDPSMSVVRWPFDPRTNIAPWAMASRMAESIGGFGVDYARFLAGMSTAPPDPFNLARMTGRLSQWAAPLAPGCVAHTLNLKQFRSSQNPDLYCFQAVTNGPMRFTAVNRFGMLGEQSVQTGDSTGGFTIRLHRWPNLPIFETLGLDATRRWAGPGAEVVQLKPLLPYWYDVNMEYLDGYNIAWRSQDPRWRDRCGRIFPPARNSKVPDEDKRFNTTLGASNKALAGPFRFTGTTVRVLPLLARRGKLDRLLNRYLNDPLRNAGERFRPWTSADSDPSGEAGEFGYVYLTATVYGEVTSETNNLGDWADAEVAFQIPVLRETWDEETQEWHVCGIGLVPAFIYVDSATAAAAGAEVLGLPSSRANFVRPESAWMTEVPPGSEAHQMLLRVDAEVLPARGEGQEAQMRTILSITAGELVDAAKMPEMPMVVDRWAATMKKELSRKKKADAKRHDHLRTLRSLTLAILGNRVPLSFFTLKQLRDVSNPNHACYQSLVCVQRTLNELLDFREIEMPLAVRIQESPSHPLVETLGLIGTPVAGDGLGAAYALQPVRPFWIRLNMDETLGQRLLHRAGSVEWSREDRASGAAPGSYLCPKGQTQVGVTSGRLLDQGDARRLVRTVLDSAARGDEKEIELALIEEALRSIDPQTVIESILSREWGNWNENARWRVARRRLAAELRESLAGADWENLEEADEEFFSQVLARSGLPPGRPPVREEEKMRKNLARLNRTRVEMERAWLTLRKAGPPDPLAETNTSSEQGTRDHLRTLLQRLIEIGNTQILGDPSSPDTEIEQGAHDNTRRIHDLIAREFQRLLTALDEIEQGAVSPEPPPEFLISMLENPHEVAAHAPPYWMEGLQLARERVNMQREALLNHIVRAFQKPDFVIRRDWAGSERNRLFPEAQSWDDSWYYGAAEPEDDPADA